MNQYQQPPPPGQQPPPPGYYQPPPPGYQPPPPGYGAPPPGYGAPPGERPTGVTILAVLNFIGGIFAIIGAVQILALGGGMMGIPGLGTLMMVCGGITLLIGVVYLIVGWGLWTMQSWAWIVAVIFAILGLINIPIGTIISIIILVYLFKPEIKAAFGRM